MSRKFYRELEKEIDAQQKVKDLTYKRRFCPECQSVGFNRVDEIMVQCKKCGQQYWLPKRVNMNL